MPQIVSHDEVKNDRKQRDLPNGHAQWRTDFISPGEGQDGPQAFLAESTPKRLLRTHYHAVDQFQVVVKGGGVLGKHKLAVHGVHFTRPYTPYGPIVNGEEGIGFITLRVRRDWKRAQYFPESREQLAQVTDRNPWQVTELAKFVESGDASVHEFSEIKDERGLGAFSVKLKPHAELAAPDPAQTAGQYVIVTGGSLVHNGREYKALSIALVKPEEGPMQLVGGSDGLEALVLNYPRHEAGAQQPHAAKSSHARVWQCALCAFTYDEAKGMPEEGIAAGTRWEDVPDTWACPDCSASKSDFQMSVIG